jgi:hypothetical protein
LRRDADADAGGGEAEAQPTGGEQVALTSKATASIRL